VHLAYIDDSGDERSMVLGAVLVPAVAWLEVHDRLASFRSRLSKAHGFRMRWELKAGHLVSRSSKGNWRKLQTPTRTRHGIYLAALRELGGLAPEVRTVAVVAPDRNHARVQTSAVEDCWDVLLQRLERFATKNDTQIMLLPDDGNPLTVRKLARRKRRFGYAPSAYGGDARRVPFTQLVDDPVHRNSAHSYLIQWADLVAHAAFRRVIPRSDGPAGLWEAMGGAVLGEANQIERGRGADEPPGLIVWPDRAMPPVH